MIRKGRAFLTVSSYLRLHRFNQRCLTNSEYRLILNDFHDGMDELFPLSPTTERMGLAFRGVWEAGSVYQTSGWRFCVRLFLCSHDIFHTGRHRVNDY